ncbi:hypothetical protein OF83DRAFT_1176147 [Amylostereum chailletii]|nr:hypothetical protein OF83DRAFT_1176147 [Amylostereum chailletii]
MAMRMVLFLSSAKQVGDTPTTPSVDGAMVTVIAVSTPNARSLPLRVFLGQPTLPHQPAAVIAALIHSAFGPGLIPHKKWYSSGSDLGLWAVGTAPTTLLSPVHGLKVGPDMRISQGSEEPATTNRATKRGRRSIVKPTYEFGAVEGTFSSPEVHLLPCIQTQDFATTDQSSQVSFRSLSPLYPYPDSRLFVHSLTLGKNCVHSLVAWTPSTKSKAENTPSLPMAQAHVVLTTATNITYSPQNIDKNSSSCFPLHSRCRTNLKLHSSTSKASPPDYHQHSAASRLS